jgi:hypothetical protein
MYDANNYNFVTLISVEDNVAVVKDENYNTYKVGVDYLYTINEELTNKYGIAICDEHNELDGEYPYYIPIADENAYEFELTHFAMNFS